MYGWANNLNDPIGEEKWDQNGAGKEIYNSPQLFRRVDGGWEDRGTFITNRLENGGVDAKQLEQFEMRQMGPQEYARRMAIALKSGDQDTIDAALKVRPELAKSLRNQIAMADPDALNEAQEHSTGLRGVFNWFKRQAHHVSQGISHLFSFHQIRVDTLRLNVQQVDAVLDPNRADQLLDRYYGGDVPLGQLRANRYRQPDGGSRNVIPDDVSTTTTDIRGVDPVTVTDPVIASVRSSARSNLKSWFPTGVVPAANYSIGR
jgi:hypothetical protein